MTAIRNGLIDRQVREFADWYIRYKRALDGDRYATAEEARWLLDDPTAALDRRQYDAVLEVAADMVRRSGRPDLKVKVRALLRVIHRVLEADALGQWAEDQAGLPHYAPKPLPMFVRRPVHRAMTALGLSQTEVLETLTVFAELEAMYGMPCYGSPWTMTIIDVLVHGE